MGNWVDQEKWNGLIDGSECPICQRGVPLNIISESESSWLTMPEEAPMQGYQCLVSKVHAVELFDLSMAESHQFMNDVRAVASAVSKATGAVKINYEVHGNILPHLHMHFFPRFPGDPFEGRKIDLQLVEQPMYKPGDYDRSKNQLLENLEWNEF